MLMFAAGLALLSAHSCQIESPTLEGPQDWHAAATQSYYNRVQNG